MFIVVLFALFLITVSAHTPKAVDASEGYAAPYFSLEQNDTSVSLDDMKGKYLLLTFWASKDAASRIMCQEYASFARTNQNEQFSHVAVNFDRSERLFQEIVKRDNLYAEAQYYAHGEKAAQLLSSYHLEDGFKTYLIDPQGRVVAKNPSTSHLTQILNH